MVITAVDIRIMRLTALLAGVVIGILLLLSLIIRVVLLGQMIPLIDLERQVNEQQARTTAMRQHTLEYIQNPIEYNQQVVQQDLTNWSQQNALLLTQADRYTDGIAGSLAKVAAPAAGIRFYTQQIINEDDTQEKRQKGYAQQTLYVGQNNIMLIGVESYIIQQAMDTIYTSFRWTVVITIVIFLVMIAEGFVLHFWLFKPLWKVYHNGNNHTQASS